MKNVTLATLGALAWLALALSPLLFLLLLGCTEPARLAVVGWYDCHSTVTGETRSFHSSQVIDARHGFLGAATLEATIQNPDGSTWVISSDDPDLWRCEFRAGPPPGSPAPDPLDEPADRLEALR